VVALDEHVADRAAVLVALLDLHDLLAVDLVGAGGLVVTTVGLVLEDVVEEGVEVAELREARVAVDDPLVADRGNDRVGVVRSLLAARTPRRAGTSSRPRWPAPRRCRPRSRSSPCTSPSALAWMSEADRRAAGLDLAGVLHRVEGLHVRLGRVGDLVAGLLREVAACAVVLAAAAAREHQDP
jgi:hypothetical protein